MGYGSVVCGSVVYKYVVCGFVAYGYVGCGYTVCGSGVAFSKGLVGIPPGNKVVV